MSAIEEQLPGGNVGGAVKVGDTVRRETGPWTPAVHAFLAYLAPRVPYVPRVLGFDERGREVLSYLPGKVIDTDTGTESLSLEQITALVRWTRDFHHAAAGFSHPGPWRYFPLTTPSLIGHNDIAPYNVCFDGDALAGVFDWDLAGPTTPLYELAFIAWNCVPLWRDIGAEAAAARLTVIADSYSGYPPSQILRTVPYRIRTMLDGIPVAAAAGDEGMARLLTRGEPDQSSRALAGLLERIPGIDRLLTAR